jgi:hypothetical protein
LKQYKEKFNQSDKENRAKDCNRLSSKTFETPEEVIKFKDISQQKENTEQNEKSEHLISMFE